MICFTKQQLTDFFNQGKNAPSFKSSHWDEPNVISHLRLNERTYKGKKVTFMEEMQSDWAREGRSKGFIGDSKTNPRIEAKKYLDREGIEIVPEMDGGSSIMKGDKYLEYDDLDVHTQNAVDKYLDGAETFNEIATTGVPNNPLLKNWQELSVKRALKEAVDNNSEYLAWTTGEQQAARYNLSTQLESIRWDKPTDLLQKSSKVKSVELKAVGRARGEDMKITVDESGKVVETLRSAPSEWKGKQLGDVIGKGISEKILAEPKGNLSGEGLNIGGEWAKNLYDKQVKNIVEDLTGHGVETIDLGLPIGNEELFRVSKLANGREWGVFTKKDSDLIQAFKTEAEATKFVESKTPKAMQQAIRLTPEIKALVKGEALKLK